MSPTRTVATAGRVLRQLRHDPRTLALILVVPCVLMTLLKYVFDGQPQVFNSVGPVILGIFPFTIMFIITSIATLRERSSGTLERLLAMPLSKLDFLFGYAIAFSILAILQAVLVAGVSLGLLGMTVQGAAWQIIVVAVWNGLLGMSLGLFLSAFARSEFQAVQFMPAFVLPQVLLCGLLIPRDQMAQALQWVADVMPLTYAVDAMKLAAAGTTGADLRRDLLVVIGFTFGALMLGAATLRRQT